MTTTAILICSALLAVFATLLIWSEYKRGAKERYIFKSLASLMFILLGLISLLFYPGARAWPVFAGLVASLAGDEFLAVYDHRRQSRYFLLGLGAFGVAQAFYSAYFLPLGETVLWSALLAVIITIASLGGIVTFKMKLKRLLLPVLVYSLLLSFAFANALLALIASFSPQLLAMTLGMGLFLLSDIVLLFKYFYAKAPRSLTIFNLGFYYLAQLLLCLGITLLV